MNIVININFNNIDRQTKSFIEYSTRIRDITCIASLGTGSLWIRCSTVVNLVPDAQNWPRCLDSALMVRCSTQTTSVLKTSTSRGNAILITIHRQRSCNQRVDCLLRRMAMIYGICLWTSLRYVVWSLVVVRRMAKEYRC